MDGGGAERAPWGGAYGQPHGNDGWAMRRGYTVSDMDTFDRRPRPDMRRDGDRGGRRGRRGGGVRTSPPPPGTIRLSDHAVPNSLWDVPARGFEEVDALAAKSTGLFGAPANSGMAGMMMLGLKNAMPTTVPASATPEIDPTIAAAVTNGLTHLQLRRLHVEPIEPGMTAQALQAFVNAKMNERLLCSGGSTEPCFHVDWHADKGYALVDFRSPDEATNAVLLDGARFLGHVLSFQRPKDYVGPDVVPPPGTIATTVPDGPNKLFIGRVPLFLDQGQVLELLQPFGEVKHLDLIRDEETGRSRGMAYCEFSEDAATDLACEGLDGLEVGEQRLIVRRALAPSREPPAPPVQETSDTPTRAMLLLNMVTTEELLDDQEFHDIVEDVRGECSRYGHVTSVYIPRPLPAGAPGIEPAGVGRVYVQFAQVPECEAALRAIAGRQFDGRTVICAYVKDEAWPAAAP